MKTQTVYLVKVKLNNVNEPLRVLGVFSSKRKAYDEITKLGFDYFSAVYSLQLNEVLQ